MVQEEEEPAALRRRDTDMDTALEETSHGENRGRRRIVRAIKSPEYARLRHDLKQPEPAADADNEEEDPDWNPLHYSRR